jgi:glyoxylase-like metal-dependent hydrolase (beta-lactamase superfamily II)
MIFRQLFEPGSSTYTYLIGCRDSGLAVLVDPVLESVDRDLEELRQLGLTLAFTIDTHIHADHITSAARLRSLTGCKIAYAGADAPAEADLSVSEVDPIDFGSLRVQPLFTPGHTE